MELGYDNETGSFYFDEWAGRKDCLWLVNTGAEPYRPDRFYIIPPPDITAEIAGVPDDKVLDALNAFCRDHDGIPTEAEYQSLGLELVSMDQRGFNVHQGYYFHW